MNEFVLANYAKIIKKYSSKDVTDEELLNDLFFSICGPIDLMGKKNGEPYTVSKGNASDLMNRNASVPVDIRKGSLKVNLSEVESYFVDILKQLDQSKSQELIAEIRALYSNKEDYSYNPILEASFNECIDTPNKFLARTFIQCLQNENKLIAREVIYEKGRGNINIETGDLLKIAFNTKTNADGKIIVIPVDADFTMKVEGLDNKEKKLISPNSIHGQWIEKVKDINNDIKEYVSSYIKEHKVPKQIGSTVPYKINNTMFYLFAISKLDENNNAHCSKDELKEAISSLLNYYDKNGQGYPMYVPLLGTGLSRTKLNHQKSIELIKSTFLENEDKINGEITIIVYKKDIKKMEEK